MLLDSLPNICGYRKKDDRYFDFDGNGIRDDLCFLVTGWFSPLHLLQASGNDSNLHLIPSAEMIQN